MGVSHFIVTGFAAGEGMDRGMCGCILFCTGEGIDRGMCGCITFHCDRGMCG